MGLTRPSRLMLCIVQEATCSARQLPPDGPNKCPSKTRRVSTTAATDVQARAKQGMCLPLLLLHCQLLTAMGFSMRGLVWVWPL